jgi:hypothetical protein
LRAAAPALATVWSFSTVLPETPMAPMMVPSGALRGMPPGKEMRPRLETSVVEGAAGLGEFTDVAGVHIEVACSFGFLDRDIDGAEPGAVLADEGLEVSAGVDHGDVHLGFDFSGLGHGGDHDEVGLFGADVLGVDHGAGVGGGSEGGIGGLGGAEAEVGGGESGGDAEGEDA